MIYLLDTDTLIYVVRGIKILGPRNPAQRRQTTVARRIVERCRANQSAGHEVVLSAITVAELEYGAHRSGDYAKEITAVRKIATPFDACDFDASICAEKYGEVRHALEQAGTPIGAMDLLLAGHALALEATMVSNNIREYSRVPGLKVENWSEP
jgi:tRNA(fMet)-specific endonuclease VapC